MFQCRINPYKPHFYLFVFSILSVIKIGCIRKMMNLLFTTVSFKSEHVKKCELQKLKVM
jgi:hypothetical protein